jgi:hypothetical protein
VWSIREPEDEGRQREARAVTDTPSDPRCPECGGKIGATATYCMHCSADLTDERRAADADADGVWDGAELDPPQSTDAPTDGDAGATGGLLDPEGLVDDSLTVVVGILGGIVVGVVGTVVLGIVTGSAAGVGFGVVAWLVTTAYLVRQRTVQGAVSKSGYSVAVVLLLVPLVAVSPVVDVEGGLSGRSGLFVVLLLFVVVPAAIAAGIGWLASRYVPTDPGDGESQ